MHREIPQPVYLVPMYDLDESVVDIIHPLFFFRSLKEGSLSPHRSNLTNIGTALNRSIDSWQLDNIQITKSAIPAATRNHYPVCQIREVKGNDQCFWILPHGIEKMFGAAHVSSE